MFSLFSDWRFSLGIALVSVVFFGALTLHSLIRPDHRSYLPSLLLIDFGLVNSLFRKLFFYDLAADPATLGGMWRLATGAIVLWGFVRFERTWRRERRAQKG
jgi:hypothetical protein